MGLQYGFGSGVLYGIRTDVSNSTPVRFGTLQDVSIDFNGEIKELFGQQQYPVDTARGKTKIQGKAKFAQISGPEYNNLFFGESIQSGGQKLQAFNEQQTATATTAVSSSTTSASLTGSTIVNLASTAGIYAGMTVTGSASIPSATTVSSISGNSVTLSAALTGGILINVPLTFTPLALVTSTPAGTVGSALLTFASTTGVAVGQVVSSSVAGIPAGATVAAFTGTSVTLSAPLTAAFPIGSTVLFAPLPTVTSTFGGSGLFDTDLGTLYSASGLPLTYTSTTPINAGSYSYNASTGVYTLSPFDGSASVLLNYLYTSTSTGFKITGANLLMGTTPRFQAVFSQTYAGNTLTLKLFACTSSKLAIPTKIDDYVINEVDFMAFANAAGNVFELSTTS